MEHSESEMVAARLARIKTLLDACEEARSDSTEQRALFQKLRDEIKAARAALEEIPMDGFE